MKKLKMSLFMKLFQVHINLELFLMKNVLMNYVKRLKRMA